MCMRTYFLATSPSSKLTDSCTCITFKTMYNHCCSHASEYHYNHIIRQARADSCYHDSCVQLQFRQDKRPSSHLSVM